MCVCVCLFCCLFFLFLLCLFFDVLLFCCFLFWSTSLGIARPLCCKRAPRLTHYKIGKNVKQHTVASTAVRIARWLRITQEVRQTLLTRPAAAGPSTCGSRPDDVHRYGRTGAKRAKQRKHSESIKQKTMGHTGIAYEAPVANKNVRKNIRRASFAIYFWGFPNIPLCKFRNRLWDFRMSLGAAGKTENTHLRQQQH